MAKVKKGNSHSIIWMVLYWAVYLTVTMALFERFHITPESVPSGFIGWMVIVEVPRVILGFVLSIPFFRKASK